MDAKSVGRKHSPGTIGTFKKRTVVEFKSPKL